MMSCGGQSKGYPPGTESTERRRVMGQRVDLTGSRGDGEHLSNLCKLMNEKGRLSPQMFNYTFLSQSKEADRCAAFMAEDKYWNL